jgi:DNA invertase Pin-like site-specific DNA recombinase
VAYSRVSSDQQADSGLGLEAQRSAIQRWADARSISIVAWTEDAGVSGASELEKRAGLMQAIAALREHKAGVLVVAKRDRLARDVILAAMAERLVAREGAIVASTAGEGEGTDPAAMLMRRMVDAFAEYERALIRARTSSALQAKMARGERLGAARVGERLSQGEYEPRAEELELIARSRELRQRGLSLREIQLILAEEGHLSRRGNAPRLATLHALLRPGKSTG